MGEQEAHSQRELLPSCHTRSAKDGQRPLLLIFFSMDSRVAVQSRAAHLDLGSRLLERVEVALVEDVGLRDAWLGGDDVDAAVCSQTSVQMIN